MFAIETAKIAFAPILFLFGEPSSLIKVSSIPFWSSASLPKSASEIRVLTLLTALRTPLPEKTSPPSLNS